MGVEVNKFGVPYHAYELTLDDGRVVNFDMAWEEYWGDVVQVHDWVGYGNDDDGYRKIVAVKDVETRRFVGSFDFLRKAESYVSSYAEG